MIDSWFDEQKYAGRYNIEHDAKLVEVFNAWFRRHDAPEAECARYPPGQSVQRGDEHHADRQADFLDGEDVQEVAQRPEQPAHHCRLLEIDFLDQ